MRLLWLPDVLRAAGLSVQTYPGWETRGSSSWGPLRGIVCHATAGARNSSDAGEMRVLWETGSPTAPVPIAQLYLSRTGQWWVGASGLCYHVLVGQRGPHRGYGNAALIGVEAANDNRGEPWPAVQLESYVRGVAAICRYMGWSADVAVGHREHQNDKSDPVGIDMNDFRRRVAALLAEEDDMDTKTFADIVTTLLLGATEAGYWDPARVTDGHLKNMAFHVQRLNVAAVERRLTERIDGLEARLTTGGVNVDDLAARLAPAVADALAQRIADAVADKLAQRLAE